MIMNINNTHRERLIQKKYPNLVVKRTTSLATWKHSIILYDYSYTSDKNSIIDLSELVFDDDIEIVYIDNCFIRKIINATELDIVNRNSVVEQMCKCKSFSMSGNHQKIVSYYKCTNSDKMNEYLHGISL